MNTIGQALISVIIPVYNRCSLLGETLNSVCSQTFSKWECIVVDDNSTDYTEELMEFFVRNDSRIRYFKRPETWSKGANSCRNYGFKQSKGEYIQWLDSDDIISEEKLEKQLQIMAENQADLATCKWGRFYQMSDAWILDDLKAYEDFDSSLEFFEALAHSKGFFPVHAYLLKRELVEKSGGWLSFLNINQDGEFITRVIINSNKICFSQEGIAYYRFSQGRGASAYDSSQKVQNLIDSWRIIEAYLRIKYARDHFDFILNAKKNIFQANVDRQEVMQKNSDFFKGIRKRTLGQVMKKILFK